MVLRIESDVAHRLARELAEARGTSLTDAVTTALSGALKATGRPRVRVETLLAEVQQVQALVEGIPDRDTRSTSEILGYGELGMPG